jgi:hypothetical protein
VSLATRFLAALGLPIEAIKASAAGQVVVMGKVGQPQWSDSRQYSAIAREGYRLNVVVFRCIRAIACGGGGVPIYLQQRTAGGTGKPTEIYEHPLLDLRRRHVDVHHPISLALLIVGRRHQQREIEPDHAQHDREPAGPGQHRIGDPLIAQRVGEAVHHHNSGPDLAPEPAMARSP